MDARKNTRQHQKKKKDALPDYCAAKHADGVCALKRNKHIFFLCVIIKFPLKSHFFNSLIPLPHFDLYKCPTRITAVLTHFSAAPMNYLLRLPSPTAPPLHPDTQAHKPHCQISLTPSQTYSAAATARQLARQTCRQPAVIPRRRRPPRRLHPHR